MKRNADGSYGETYQGRAIAVRKELSGGNNAWTARSGDLVRQDGTRQGAVDRIKQLIDAEDIDLPELDAFLKRMAERVRSVAARLNNRDVDAQFRLTSLRSDFDRFESMTRLTALHLEEGIAGLEARMQEAPEHKALEGSGLL
jgi:hypothetical protein